MNPPINIQTLPQIPAHKPKASEGSGSTATSNTSGKVRPWSSLLDKSEKE